MISDFLIKPGQSIQHALDQLDKVKGLGLIVINEKNELVGSLTDGDIRRAIISGRKVHENIDHIINKNPVFRTLQTPISELKEITSDKRIKIIPLLEDNKVVDIYVIDDEDIKSVTVVIMAGGLGSRLGEHTKECPKPMIDIGGKPVLERIIRNFTKVGFVNFFISVNYKAEIIENYFQDGARFNCNICYLRENKRLGTAGSLSLLPESVNGPIVVTNGDLLTMMDFRRLLSYHRSHKSPITLCTRRYEFQVPFGVVQIDNGLAIGIDEKPTHSFNVSAGVYVINSSLLSFIPKDECFDMPNFFDILLKNDIKADCFAMIEHWIDIGRVSDLDYARSIYENSND